MNSIILFGFSINLNPYSLGSGQTLVQNFSNSNMSIHKKDLFSPVKRCTWRNFTWMATSVLPEEISLEWSPHRISCTELRSWFKITLTLGRIRVKINIYMSRLHQRGDKFHRCLTQVMLWSFFFSLIKNAADCSYKIALFQYWILLYY